MFLNTNTQRIIKLYRGDFEKIDTFKVKKTDKRCLYGPGIYLTTDEKVANTYRTKGQWDLHYISDIAVNAVNKNEAMEKILGMFQELRYKNRLATLLKNGSKDTSKERVNKILQNEFEDGLNRGHLVITRDPYKKEVKGVSMFEFTLKDKTPKTHGWVTSFEFEEAYLNKSVIQVDATAIPNNICEILEDSRFWKSEEAKKEFLKCKSFHTSSRVNTHRMLDHVRFIQELQNHGIEGYRHFGGVVTNSRRHNVYILFNDEFVNMHKVETMK